MIIGCEDAMQWHESFAILGFAVAVFAWLGYLVKKVSEQ